MADRTLTLKSSDDKEFKLPASVAKASVTITNLLEDVDEENQDKPIPIPNVDGATLEKVISYISHHKDDPPVAEVNPEEKTSEEITGWDLDFVKATDMLALFKLMNAVNFLDIKPLLDLATKHLAHQVRGKNEEEIRGLFGITEPFTKEFQDKVRADEPWCDDTK